MDLVLAFLTGLTTGGLSCLAVQGGLLASSVAHEVEQSAAVQPVSRRKAKPQPVKAGRPILLFLAAKLVAYTVLGFLLGLVGSVLQLSTTVRAVLLSAIGVFMVGTALRMLNVHPIFRYFALEPPSFVTRYIRRKARGQASAITPLFLGALTVLIPCGVTQAMMAVAMGTGNAVSGATLMFAFILGTSPVFFAVAYTATRLGSRWDAGFMRVVAVVVLVLGLISIDSGLTLVGSPYSFTNIRLAMAGRSSEVGPAKVAAAVPGAEAAPHATPASGALIEAVGPAVSASGVVTITVNAGGYQPTVTRAAANRPFELALVTNKTYSCARAFVIPSLGIQKILPPTGTVRISLPAQRAGSRLFFTCSMGMYSGVIEFNG